ncbi:HIT family protein [Leifsonia sp. 21MFCrub1.1]|uniref:HIT family protein n=1 Tax=Leifsonia sp. 21MFCrub1.1 TaxID=1798223 RepID=UPI0012FD1C10|nr:HIT family protein [Leifsonia sp. 21MFCrub1.1]
MIGLDALRREATPEASMLTIVTTAGSEYDATCDFCRIVRRELTARVVYETNDTLAFFPLEPATTGHTMIIPKRHVANFLELLPADFPQLGEATVRVARALMVALGPDGMNVVSSAGRVASQTVMHAHVHLVPRWPDDAVGEIWPTKKPTSAVVLDDTADAVREILNAEHLEERNY